MHSLKSEFFKFVKLILYDPGSLQGLLHLLLPIDRPLLIIRELVVAEIVLHGKFLEEHLVFHQTRLFKFCILIL